MRILVLGSGAREHAIILALRSEDAAHDVFAAPGNAGIGRDATIVELDQNDPAAVTGFANENAIHLVVIGPEAPLVAGVADALRERGIPVFGPGKAAAQLEGSKTFAKDVMQAAGVATAETLPVARPPCVVKADGLAAGKGVFVCRTQEELDAALPAAAAFGGYLRELGLVTPPATVTIDQGIELGRPSLLTVTIPAEGGISVSGTAVPI